MNSAKTLLVVAVLAAVGAGAYLVFKKEPPPAPISDADWGQTPKTKFGQINDQSSSATGDFDPNATSGGPPPRWNPGTNPAGGDSRALAPFDAGSHSFEQPAGNPGTLPQGRLPSDTIPNSGKFGSQDSVSLPTLGGYSVDVVGLTATTYGSAMVYAQELIRNDKLAQALAMLTRFYDDPKLSAAEHEELNKQLDQLAGTVIYSREHYMTGHPHIVRAGERLQDIAKSYKVPWQLLAKINGIKDPDHLEPGTQLKVLQGPFRAIISLDKKELTLKVQNHYAGRFSFRLVGTVPEGVTRTRVRTKNSTGARFLDLDNNVRIRGPQQSTDVGTVRSTAVLSQQDIEDVFDILQVQSDVLIRR